jgi:cell wall-associated NlpC family hydrolase
LQKGLLWLATALLLQACASSPYRPAAPAVPPSAPPLSTGNEIAIRAMALVGVPYEFGGNGPTTFDCSGLVRYVHAQLGIVVPRTAAEQYAASKHVSLQSLEPGDLLFFRTHGKRISHVAIYAGEGRFVHAPQTGRPVELRTLDDEFYHPRLAGAGRMF